MAAARLRDMGFQDVADAFDEFVRVCIASQSELTSRADDEINGDPSSSNHEAQSRQDMIDGLIQHVADLEEFAKPSPAAARLSELLLKVKELETHSEGGPYQDLLISIRKGVERAQSMVNVDSDAAAQCGAFGESYLLKPLVHYLSCWDVRARKESKEAVVHAAQLRDQAYQQSIELAFQNKVAEARAQEGESMLYGEKAIQANARQREALATLKRASDVDLDGYHNLAVEFIGKWRTAYQEALDQCERDLDHLTRAHNIAGSVHGDMNANFADQVRAYTSKLEENAARKQENMRQLQRILDDELQRQKELQEHEYGLKALQKSLKMWTDEVKQTEAEFVKRKELTGNAIEALSDGLKSLEVVEQTEALVNKDLQDQMIQRKESLAAERKRLLQEYLELSKEQLKLYNRKSDRLRRRVEKLEQRRQDCFFAIEMAFESETPTEELQRAPELAERHGRAIQEAYKQIQVIHQRSKQIDNQDLAEALAELQVPHPAQAIKAELQRERDAYNDRMLSRLKQHQNELCSGTVQYIDAPASAQIEMTDAQRRGSYHQLVLSPGGTSNTVP